MPILILILAYLFIGLIAGFIGGLLGIGGGVITVPSFFVLFYLYGYPKNDLLSYSIGTSLAVMMINTFSSTWSQHQLQNVKWDVFRKMALGLVLGSLLGAFVASWLPEKILEIFFGIFLCILSVIFHREKLPIFNISENMNFILLKSTSFITGILSSLLGIGGGILTVPLLISIKIPVKNAMGTSSSITLLVSFIGTLSYILFGWNQSVSSLNLGYVHLPAFFIVGFTTLFSAQLGVKYMHQIDLRRIQKFFAYMLMMTGLTFLILNIFP